MNSKSVTFNVNQPPVLEPVHLNEYIVCVICFGYLRDAYTIKECLHTFCKSCIYKYFSQYEDCPRCGTSLHPDPYLEIRQDPIMQRLVDKIFPQVLQKDIEREIEFYKERNLTLPSELQRQADRDKVKERLVDSKTNSSIPTTFKQSVDHINHKTNSKTQMDSH